MDTEPVVSAALPPSDLWGPFLTALPISGASVTVVTASGARLTLGSSDRIAARIDELQFELGEGPQSLAARTGELVAIPDVVADGHHEWPVLGSALRELAVGAIFSIPIRMGAVTLGVATLYCDAPRDLTSDQRAAALAIGSAIAGPVTHLAMRSATDESSLESLMAPALRREVHQATGIILAQLNTTATIAYARLRAYAFANGRTIQVVAHDVVTGSLSFEEDVS